MIHIRKLGKLAKFLQQAQTFQSRFYTQSTVWLALTLLDVHSLAPWYMCTLIGQLPIDLVNVTISTELGKP